MCSQPRYACGEQERGLCYSLHLGAAFVADVMGGDSFRTELAQLQASHLPSDDG